MKKIEYNLLTQVSNETENGPQDRYVLEVSSSLRKKLGSRWVERWKVLRIGEALTRYLQKLKLLFFIFQAFEKLKKPESKSFSVL